MARVLVVDDDEGVLRFVSRALRAAAITADTTTDGRRAVAMTATGAYELVLLDLLLGPVNGVAVLQAILERQPDQRVLVVSGVADVAERVRCLQLGASDFLLKPFALGELVARVNARLRETRQPAEDVEVDGLRLDVHRRVVHTATGTVHLSEREFLLLEHLMRRPGQVCTREELLRDVWGFSFDTASNVVEAYVKRLRAKVGTDRIRTVRLVGYQLPVSTGGRRPADRRGVDPAVGNDRLDQRDTADASPAA